MFHQLCSSLAVFGLAAIFLAAGSARGQESSAKTPRHDSDSRHRTLPPQEQTSTTQGSVNVEGQTIQYTAVAGTLTVGATRKQNAMLGMNGQPLPGSTRLPKDPAKAPATAQISYVAYFKQSANADRRPITFLYNGGPGSSTVWLQMGAFGPRRVASAGDIHLPAAPYHLENNSYSLLDASDLVFIDAPGTGFGRMYGKDKDKAFWGVDQDGHAFARFITRFLTKYNRWNSPKYLFGESYGTTRSAVLANILENEDNVDPNGVILLSQVLNFADLPDGTHANPGDDRPYELELPTFAAVAIYHHKLPQPPALVPFLNQVQTFALGDYAHALSEGNQISATETQTIAEKLHTFTGLPVAYLIKANLRVSGGEFEKMLQDSNDLTTGRLDARFSGPTLVPLSRTAAYDPQSAAISSAYVSLYNQYARQVLKVGDERPYVPEALFGTYAWNMKHTLPNGSSTGGATGVNVMPDLATAMKTNPRLQVLLNCGYYDMATPYFAALYETHHLPIEQSLAANIHYAFYKSGHMVYVRDQSLHRLHDNVAAFIRSTDSGWK